MTKSKGWQWNNQIDVYWKTVADEFIPIAFKWLERQHTAMNVLDLGCGIGRNSIFLAKLGFNVHAFDISEEALRKLNKEAKINNLNIVVKKGDMVDLNYDDGFFSFVLAFHSIYHTDFNGLKIVLDQIARVLKKNGEAFITFISKESDEWERLSQNHIDNYTLVKSENPEKGIPHTYVTYEEILDLMSLSFEIKKINQIWEYFNNLKHAHFYVHCLKK